MNIKKIEVWETTYDEIRKKISREGWSQVWFVVVEQIQENVWFDVQSRVREQICEENE